MDREQDVVGAELVLVGEVNASAVVIVVVHEREHGVVELLTLLVTVELLCVRWTRKKMQGHDMESGNPF